MKIKIESYLVITYLYSRYKIAFLFILLKNHNRNIISYLHAENNYLILKRMYHIIIGKASENIPNILSIYMIIAKELILNNNNNNNNSKLNIY